MTVLIKILQFVLSLSILVIIHELGHFLMAKYFKTRVEKFYLFFDPWFALFKFKRGETEYGVGWLPLGGYAIAPITLVVIPAIACIEASYVAPDRRLRVGQALS